MRRYQLIEIEWPEFGEGQPPPRPSVTEYLGRMGVARRAMEARGLTHLVVYGDREHFANMTYLTGFDPRFEEALLVIARHGTPLLIVGNECEGYLPVSPLYVAGELRSERFQTFSLLNQPRDSSRYLREILGDQGVSDGAVVGCVGWKYLTDAEHPDSLHAIDLP
ncbi:MAG: hypothetical protein ACK2UX_10140, partial [Anaerolineae bacterium]